MPKSEDCILHVGIDYLSPIPVQAPPESSSDRPRSRKFSVKTAFDPAAAVRSPDEPVGPVAAHAEPLVTSGLLDDPWFVAR
jgi:hypothetical protein